MRELGKFILVLFVIALQAAFLSGCSMHQDHTPLKAENVCSLDSLPQLPDVTITSATHESAPVSHCKVAGVIGPEINFELRLPADWNGKFVFGGGGGYVGMVINTSLLLGSLEAGYASVGTDTGHKGHPMDASWALHNMERIVNFGHQAVHRTTVTAKALIKAYYRKDISRNYFFGCSRGGGQALMEAQRYPEDFDGIVAGAPAYNWTMGIGATMTQNMQAMYPDPDNLQQAIVGPKEQELIASSYLSICDERDGIKDGILNNPRQCQFDVATLLCEGPKTDSCLSQEQVNAIITYYGGPKDSRGNSLYYGFPLGGETSDGGWSRWLTGGLKYSNVEGFQAGISSKFPAPKAPNAQWAFATNFMKYLVFHDPAWTYEDFKFDTYRADSKLVGETLNAVNPDLSAFRKRGGKLLIYTGWSDAAISALATIGYYEEVIVNDISAIDDVRLFMLPGVDHCSGGVGPSFVNYLTEIDKWVETGKAPEQLTAYWLDDSYQPDGSRLICPYPQVAKYDGAGDTRDVSSFSCVNVN